MTFKNPISEAQNVTNPDSQPLKLWIGDTAASCSTNNDDSGMFDVELIDENVICYGGQTVRATKKGKQRIFVRQKDVRITERVLGTVE